MKFVPREEFLPGWEPVIYSIFLTVYVHNKQLNFKADRDLFVLMWFSQQNKYRINNWQQGMN